MSVKIVNRFTLINAVSLFSLTVTAVIVGMYYVFNFYLTSISREVMTSWLQSEVVAIQEGNLLSSITKNQRVLLSSQFVKGVALFDTSTNPSMRLIEVGERIFPNQTRTNNSDMIQVINSGFFEKQSIYKIPKNPELVLIFSIESQLMKKFFFVSVTVFLFFIIILFGSIKAVQDREFLKREEFLKRALNDFIDQDHPSPMIEEKLPFLVQWWKEKKIESERIKRLSIESESKILLGELAARVAHDIRSPLNTINSITSTLKNIPEQSEKLIKSAIKRIRDIANDIGDHNKQILANEKLRTSESFLLFPILEDFIYEKNIEHREKNIKIEFIELLNKYIFVQINELELRRTFSNLIENAIEVTETGGTIYFELIENQDYVIIKIKDSGKGIPKHLLARIGEKGFSFGKENGSGLGVYYAKEIIESWGGCFEMNSEVGVGTTVSIRLPKKNPPPWVVDSICLSSDSTLIILDDDPTIHSIWQDIILSNLSVEMNVQHFFEPKSVISWFIQNRENLTNYFFLSDYELQVKDMNGLDVLEKLKLHSQSVLLVTSAFDDPSVRSRCEKLDIKILPKPFLPYIPVVFT